MRGGSRPDPREPKGLGGQIGVLAMGDHRRTRNRRPLEYRGEVIVCDSAFEEALQAEGRTLVAGVDEVGRGALCGPVVAGAVILGPAFDCTGLDDSKRLTRRAREQLDRRIRDRALAFALGLAEVEEIDTINILEATRLAMRRAVDALSVRPEALLLDAITLPGMEMKQVPLVKGDARSVTIAAASIIAKVARDGMMQEWDRCLPGYGLARNMGYGSEFHRDALRRMGPSRIHRRSFRGTTQGWLFGA